MRGWNTAPALANSEHSAIVSFTDESSRILTNTGMLRLSARVLTMESTCRGSGKVKAKPEERSRKASEKVKAKAVEGQEKAVERSRKGSGKVKAKAVKRSRQRPWKVKKRQWKVQGKAVEGQVKAVKGSVRPRKGQGKAVSEASGRLRKGTSGRSS